MTTINLSDLLDLSFGSCELRNIKFRVLHWCLQIIVQQLDLQKLMVEFRGKDSVFIQNEVNSSTDAVRNAIVMSVVEQHKGRFEYPQTSQEQFKDIAGKKTQLVVIQNGKVSECSGKRQQTSSPSSMSLARIEGRLRNLQTQVDCIGAQVLPGDDALLERIREEQESKPVTELLSTVNMTKRMTNAEEDIDRIASLLEVVAKEYNDLKQVMERIRDDFGQDINVTLRQIKVVSGYINNIRPREAYYHATLNKRLLKSVETSSTQLEENEKFISDEEKSLSAKWPTESDNVKIKEESKGTDLVPANIMRSDIANEEKSERQMKHSKRSKAKCVTDEYLEVLKPINENIPSVDIKNFNKLLEQHEQLKVDYEYLTVQVNTLADFAEVLLSELVENSPNIEVLKEKMREIHLKPSEYRKTKCMKRDMLEIHTELCYRIDSIEGNMNKYAGKIQLQDDMHEESLQDFSSRIRVLEKDLDEAIRNINILKMDDRGDKDEIIEKLGGKVASLDDELEGTVLRINSILRDMRTQEAILKKLKDDIFALKAGKLDRFEFDELLSEKASISQLSSKVSLDQFTNAYRYLIKCIEKISEKISTQTILWEKWIETFQELLETKMSFEEFQEISKKLMTEIKRLLTDSGATAYGEFGGPSARGTKVKYMKHLQCISCDRDVVMKMENEYPNLPVLPKMPGNMVKIGIEISEDDKFSSETSSKDKTKGESGTTGKGSSNTISKNSDGTVVKTEYHYEKHKTPERTVIKEDEYITYDDGETDHEETYQVIENEDLEYEED